MTDDSAESAPTTPALPMWGLIGQPVKLPPEFAMALATSSWSGIALEDAIATDLDWMMQFPNAAALSKEHPRAFGKKLELWRRALDTIFALVPQYRDVAADVVRRAKEVARVRNVLVHGLWPLGDPSDEGRFEHGLRGSRQVRFDHVEPNTADLINLTDEIIKPEGLVSESR